MLKELRGWSDPASKNGNGEYALGMAIAGGHHGAVDDCLISFGLLQLLMTCAQDSERQRRNMGSSSRQVRSRFIEKWKEASECRSELRPRIRPALAETSEREHCGQFPIWIPNLTQRNFHNAQRVPWEEKLNQLH